MSAREMSIIVLGAKNIIGGKRRAPTRSAVTRFTDSASAVAGLHLQRTHLPGGSRALQVARQQIKYENVQRDAVLKQQGKNLCRPQAR